MRRVLWLGSVGLFVLFGLDAQSPKQNWKSQGIIFLDRSLNARIHPVPVQAVHLGEGFWNSRRFATTEHSLPTMLDLLEQHGEIDNFRRLSLRKNVGRKGPIYSDSDVYKWIEAASWALASNETSDAAKVKFHSQIENLIYEITGAQDPSGYVNTYYSGDKAHQRFTDLTRSYEDYCLGHLIQAGIAYYRATGSRALLDPGIKFADYVVANFGPTKRPFVTGYPELETALVELYRTTGNSSYLEFVQYLFSGVERERLKLRDADIRYMFSGRAFASRTELEGHAVRALYATTGATDYFTESGDPAYKKALDSLWSDLTLRKMYITGGVGVRFSTEGFGDPYELPNLDAYAETCASVANVMWNFRLLALTGGGRYADVLEQALYNGVNSGMSLSGTLYCNRNPLASNGDKLRNPWNDPDCCPTNAERLFESLPGYFYGMSRDGVYLTLYGNSELNWHLQNGTGLHLIQTTQYPWTGDVRVAVEPAQTATFTIYLRWPSWAPSAEIRVNGQPFSMPEGHPGSFVPLSRTWRRGDVATISFPVQPTLTAANPRVTADYGRLAMQRGPLVYALEQIDQNGANLGEIFVRANGQIIAETRKDLLGGLVVIKASGQVAEKNFVDEPLYQSFANAFGFSRHPVTLTYIPYYAVGNREPAAMKVWVPVSKGGMGLTSSNMDARQP